MLSLHVLVAEACAVSVPNARCVDNEPLTHKQNCHLRFCTREGVKPFESGFFERHLMRAHGVATVHYGGNPFIFCFTTSESVGEHRKLREWLQNPKLQDELVKYAAWRDELQAMQVIREWSSVLENVMLESSSDECERLRAAAGKPQTERTSDENAVIKRNLWPSRSPYKQADVEQAARVLFGTAYDGFTNAAVYDIRSSLF